MLNPKMNNTNMTEEIIRTEYDLACGDRYRQEPKGDSSPTMPKWVEFEKQRRAERRKAKQKEKTVTVSETATVATSPTVVTPQTETSVEFSAEDESFIKVLNEHYGPSLLPHTKHDRMQTETSHWLCYYNDNDAQKGLESEPGRGGRPVPVGCQEETADSLPEGSERAAG